MDLSIIIRSDKRHNNPQLGNQVEALVNVLQVEIDDIRDQAMVEVIVVDSGSADGDLRSLTRQFPSVRIVPSDADLGVAQSYNLGANLARSRSLLFLSADTLLAHGSLLKCLDIVVEHPRVSLFYGEWFAHRDEPLPEGMDQALATAAVPSPGASLAAGQLGKAVPLLVSKAVLLEIGGFDENLDEQAAQQDVCARIKAFGRDVLAWNEIRAVDVGPQTT